MTLDNSRNEAARTAAKRSVSQILGADGEPSSALLAASLRDMLLRIDTVCTITGLSIATVYRLLAKGDFPRPLKITSHARAWRLSEVMDWIDARERKCG
jgi:prophage regulatory protein